MATRNARGRVAAVASAGAFWLVAAVCFAPSARGGSGYESGGTRAEAVHRIPLFDDDVSDRNKIGRRVDPDDEELVMPFSTRNTCAGTCHAHDVAMVASGWHFNAMDAKVAPGRKGEPWILTDPKTGTQLPLSYRAWAGTYRPADVGITPWKFTTLFARHFPGGGPGGTYGQEQPDPNARWEVSGALEASCMLCHDARTPDQVQWFQSTAKQNYRWAATAATGLADVTGNAAKLPEMFDIFMDENPAKPKVVYDKSRFNARGEVLMDAVRKPPAGRCYACHSRARPQVGHAGKWTTDEDVHLTAGLTCVDCHRHGLDHMIARGHEGEAKLRGVETLASLNCSGCHLGSGAEGPKSLGGRLGAPVPRHAGLPAVHFQKLTCTACHSGPWPGQTAGRERTSMAHELESHIRHHGPDVMPFIRSPVFVREADGRIGPHRVVWPAFWGRLAGGKITPLTPWAVTEAAGRPLRSRAGRSPDWKPLSQETIIAVLKALGGDKDAGEAVYVAGGRLHRLASEALKAGDHPQAAPYTWPLAHDVRPAAQALGGGPDQAGCRDCHTTDAAFFFGRVPADAPADVTPVAHEMTEFQELDSTEITAFNFTVVFRPYLKLTIFGTCAFVAAVLFWYGMRAVAAVARAFGGAKAAPTESRE